MPANIKIKISGTKETASMLRSLSTEFKQTQVPLDRSSKKYLNAISANYSDEGKTFGKAWPPLSKTTIRIKKDLQKKGAAIAVEKPLVRTGLMRRSFGFDIVGKRTARIFNTQTYAQIHQESGTVVYKGRKVKIPKRALAEVDSTRITMVTQVFVDWFSDLIRKHKAG